MAFLRQTWTLTCKNWKIVSRHSIAAIFIALILPIALTTFFSFAKNLFVPPSTYGVSDPRHIRALPDALNAASSAGRETVVFVNNGLAGGDIDRVIEILVDSVQSTGKTALRRSSTADLGTDCRSNLRGVSTCYGAVVFQASPTEGPGDYWNYTLRSDGALRSMVIDVDSDRNDAQIYLLPLQRAVDAAIASVQASSASGQSSQLQQRSLPDPVDEYPFTSITQEERAVQIRIRYQSAITNWMGVAFMTSIMFVTYHLTGFIATERESGMTRLLDAMMPVKRRWHAQAARIVSYHLAFTVLYLPGWVIGSLVLRAGVFARTSVATVLVYHVLNGISMASFSILASSFFKKAQISGIAAVLLSIILGILAQSISYPNTAAVGILSLLFAPCNYVYFITYMARWEAQDAPTNLTKVAPGSPWELTGIVLWIYLIIQIFGYPLLGAFIESKLHGTTAKGRNIVLGSTENPEDDAAVRLEGFTKIYRPSALRRLFSFISTPREPVVAVDNLTLNVRRGQILALLGANGSGKSTTLDSIAGTNKLTGGSITIDGTGGLGIAPQKNVMWDDLTVEQHIQIFNRLKSPTNLATKQEILDLIKSVDLELKRKAMSKTLSGGQKRKLQLGMMLTGGSAVCCVDEVSSGIDPLSRRKIWDILLAERGRRTIVLTTHFLDEADLLADHIAVLSKGTLRADGSSVELKDRLGGGYRVHVHKDTGIKNAPEVEGVEKKISFDFVSYIAPSSSLAALVIRTLEANGIREYKFSGPTIEDVFLQLAEEVRGETENSTLDTSSDYNEKKATSDEVLPVGAVPQGGLQLLDGHRIGYLKQAAVLFRKRITILKTNWVPHFTAFILPVAAAGLVTLFIKGQKQAGCAPSEERSLDQSQGFSLNEFSWKLVIGPASSLDLATAASVLLPVFNAASGNSGSSTGSDPSAGLEFARQLLEQNATFADTFDAFKRTVVDRRLETLPGGLWLGDDTVAPTIAYMSNYNGLLNPLLSQNFMNMLLSNVTVMMTWAPFATPWDPDTGNSLQFLVYTGIALSAYPGFFALYPSLERRRMVRGLQYSNGVRPLPLWLAYLAFDFIVVLASTTLVTILWATLSSIWYHVGFIFLIFMLYGLTAILLAYVISLFCKTQLSTYAWVAAGQAVMFLIYLVAYMCTVTYAPVTKVDDYLLVVHFVISAVAPIGSVVRAMFLALNLFSTACDGRELAQNPGGMLQYGGPILYLALQSIILFAILLWCDSGSVGSSLRRLWQRRHSEEEDPAASDEELANELARVTTTQSNDDGLRVMHLTKTFGRNTAVDNVTFGIQRGEVFALLGPNGAGKSTTISLIRGDLKPSRNGGEILVEDKSVIHNLPAARAHLGVCPQHDAMDLMTVREHLEFYARIRGIPDINHNVNAVIHAVGLQAFSTRMAHALSGGNKRKLSLGIALMGNPTVVLLDEPSSGLDAAAKRIMWKTLAATVPGRSLLLTTHSMEEADALASRAGILAKRMLALGTTDNLRRRFGDALHVHLISKTAPHTTPDETERLRSWVKSTFPGAEVEEKTYHGQMRFSVPASEVLGAFGGPKTKDITRADQDVSSSAVGQLAVMLEEQREVLGIMHYSVSPTTLDQVFLTIVGKHNVKEEGYKESEKKPWWKFRR
ncbi:ABC transporter [Colletotrichum truncatum]|uniref:ABC transporter n=1 Tax=Colletotrichum truncatum TaxID=5467 RepID=A0ACC3YQK9_COLTU|nr:ABC transporter [Colletotrichum truncatum]KAF6796554.1 ABC transporter [Colletotrichum truncatum]